MHNSMKLNAILLGRNKALAGLLALTIMAMVAVGLLPQAVAQPAAIPLVGVWIDHTGRGAVEITQCGSSLCGHIAWLKEPNQPNGSPVVDTKGRPVCGLQIIGEMKRMGDGSWDNGWIYDPEKDEKFTVELRMKSADVLQVHGYLGMKMLGETYTWRRAPASQARCTVPARKRPS